MSRVKSLLLFLYAGLPAVGPPTLVTAWAHQRGLLAPLETLCFEVSQILNLKQFIPVGTWFPEPQVQLVEIDERYYQSRFQSRRPLDPAGVGELLKAACAGKPRLVVIDLDTARWNQADVPDEPCGGAPVVWARGLRTKLTASGPVSCADPMRRQALGNRFAPIASVVRDPDGIVRRFATSVKVIPSCENGDEAPVEYPNIMEAVPALLGQPLQPGREIVMDFFAGLYDLTTIPADVMLEAACGEGWGKAGPLTGKVVVIGGTYAEARDEHMTPIGPMPGLRLLGEALNTAIDGRGVTMWSEVWLVLTEILFGYGLLAYHRSGRHRRYSLWVAAAIFGAASFVVSAFFMSTIARWPNFIPIFIGVTMHELIHQLRNTQPPAGARAVLIPPASVDYIA